jgi:flagellar protein FliS
MNASKGYGSLHRYNEINLYSEVDAAGPHGLIQQLLDGALNRIALARITLEQRRVVEKCDHIGRAFAIVEGLYLNLDRDRGGVIAANLENLYEYIGRRLVYANAENDMAALDESASLLEELREGWRGISGQAVPQPVTPGSFRGAA